MILGRVCGTVVATVQHPFYEGRKQLVVRAIKPDGSWDGDNYRVCVDIVDSGMGDIVLVEDEGNTARQLLSAPNGPVRSVIVGVVDMITMGDPMPDLPVGEATGYLGEGDSPGDA